MKKTTTIKQLREANADRQKMYRQKKYDYGLREIREWIPDTDAAVHALRREAYRLREQAGLTAYDEPIWKKGGEA